MIDIIPKYKVGEQVKFKASFKNPSCGLVGKEGTVATIAGVAPFYNNRTHYYLEGEEGVFPETLFAGRYEEA